ncbi:MAG: CsbD family protein [Bdellovibrionota bacterium]
MNESTVKGKWKEFKGEIQSQWGKLTADDIEQTKGNVTSIVGLIEQKYGKAKDDVSAKINDLATRFEMNVEEKKADAAAATAEGTEKAKDKIQ